MGAQEAHASGVMMRLLAFLSVAVYHAQLRHRQALYVYSRHMYVYSCHMYIYSRHMVLSAATELADRALSNESLLSHPIHYHEPFLSTETAC